jgi:hypothetical protein
VLLGVAIADRARALLARWLGDVGATSASADGSADAADDNGSHTDSAGGSQQQSFRSVEPKRRLRVRSLDSLHSALSIEPLDGVAASASSASDLFSETCAAVEEPGGSFRRPSIRRHSVANARLKGEVSTMLASRRARLDTLNTSRGRIAEDASGAMLSVELAADDARRMMASGRRDFSSVETILFVLSQITGTEAAQDVVSSTSDSALQVELKHAITTAVRDTLQRQGSSTGLPLGADAKDAAREIPAFFTMSRAPPLPRDLTDSFTARLCLGRVHEWDYDIFALDDATNGHALVALGNELMRPACEALGIASERLHAFLCVLEGGYRTDVPYHTSLHAADVLHSAWWLLRAQMLPRVSAGDEHLLELAILIAAAAHDVAHPGVNSDFLIKTADPLAVLYNDRSVLESMHAALCFRLLAAAETDLLAALPLGARAQVRAWVIAMILATDMKGHYALIARLGEIDDWSVGPDAGVPSADDLTFALGVLLHAADLGGPTKPTTVVRWSRRVAEEFFRQGEREQACGLKVSEGFERETAGKLWPQRNAAFVEFIVAPLFEAIVAVAPQAQMQPIMDGVNGAVLALDGAQWSMPCV